MQIMSEPFASLDDYLAWVATAPEEEHYEVVDGIPVMTPSPFSAHQRCLRSLLRWLEAACGEGHEVIPAPWDWVLWERPTLTVRQPDLVVVTHAQADEPRLTSAPLLAVEILSPVSFERDLVTKRREYAAAGLDHYWVVDPQAPQLAVFRRRSVGLDIVAHVLGDDEITLDEPFPVRLRPSALLH